MIGNAPTEQDRLLLIIQSSYPALTRTERRIADRVLADKERLIWLSITEFGDQLGVSDASIVRFCRKIGLAGFQELKLRLAQQSVSPLRSDNGPDPDDEDLVAKVQRKTVERHQRAVSDTAAMVDPKALEKAADLLVDAHRIYCFGTGASQFTAMDAAYQLLRLGLPAEVFGDTHVQAMTASTAGTGDVVVGVSVSGSTKDTLGAVSIARGNGAKVVAVTNYRRSPLAQLADVLLLTASETGPLEGGALTAKVAQLVVLDLLVATLAATMKTRAQQALTRTAQAVLDKLL
jgi:DNA-binding MurR/RpiR family transcriptional regulator